MATAAVPAAVPEPNDPSVATPDSAPSGLFTSMIAAVDPARPATFNIPAQASAEGATDAAVEGASSAAYHGSNEAGSASQNSGSAVDKKSIWRAWLLAGATRWAKGGGAANKRLDVEKARAGRAAKEDRKVTINRSDGFSGKGGAGNGAGGNAGTAKGNSGGATKTPTKSPEKGPVKAPQKEQPKTPRNSNGSAHQGPAGRSGGNGGPAGGGASRGPAGGGNNSGAAPKNGKTDAGREQKPKTDLTKGKDRGSHGGSADGKAGATGASGGAGKSGSGGTKGSGAGAASGGGNGKSPAPGGPAGKTGTGAKGDKRPNGKADSGKDHAKGSTKDGKQPGGKVDLSKGPAKSDKKNGAADSPTAKTGKGETSKGKDGKTPKPGHGTPLNTKESRLTGYRDGTRAAKAAAHVKAYRDGVKDGHRDTKKIADREKARLDKAHEERKKAQEAARDEEQDVSGAGSSADYHEAKPIEVVSIDAKNIMLGAGALRDSIGRGEVRNFVTFVARLEAKAGVMQKVADATRGLKAEAEDQAKEVTDLLEEAKSPKVKAGEKLIAKLGKLADNAKAQAVKAEEVHKRALRAADACKALLSNVKTRYEPLFMAVVNSPEIKMPELNFFRDHGYEKAA